MTEPNFRLVPYRLLPCVDWVLYGVALLLMGFGLVTLWGATSGGVGPGAIEGYAGRQLVWATMGMALMSGLIVFEYRGLRRLTWILYSLIVLALLMLLLEGIAIKGARSWYSVGPIRVQPSEVAKVIIVLTLAHDLARRACTFRKLHHTFIPLLIVALPILLILRQPDLGTAVVFIPVTGAMFWVAGLRKRVIVLFLIAGVALGGAGYPHLKPYQQERIKTFLNPEADPRGKGHNIIQAQTTLGSGQLVGRGWGRGTQTSLRFLPEYHTDFIFPTIGEQFGFMGCLLAVALFTLMIGRMFWLASVTRNLYGLLIITGLTTMLATHVVLNIGMTIGLLPITGLPLPFFSYGGSFMLTCTASIGLVLSIGARRGL